MTQCLKRYGSWFLVVAMLGIATPALSDEIRIAVRANRGSEEALSKWQATADLLSRAIPQHHFSIVPFENNSALNQAISNGSYPFSFTNPASAVELKIRYGQQPLATLVSNRQGKGYAQFGSVIFARSDRQDLRELRDLKGKVFVGVDELGFGGWRVAWNELLKNGVDPYRDLKELRFAGGNQKKVVYSVLQGAADAGSVRTDTLEAMAAAGEIELSAVKVLGAKTVPGFPFWLSTDLYPEWLFSASKTTSDELKTAVTLALLSIKKDDPAAEKGHYVGWIAPVDYTPVEGLLQDLKIGPFQIRQSGLLKEFVSQYSYILLATLVALVGLIMAFLYTAKLNRRITQTQASLKAEIASRERAEQVLTSLAEQSLGFAKEKLFFNHCLTKLAHFFAAELAFIGVFADAEKTRIKTYAVWSGGQFIDNFEYAIEGTPCQDVLNLDVELISEGTASKYPKDALLKQMGIESYFGAPLVSSDGAMMGLVAVMDTKPMKPEKGVTPILRIFANRIALEMQRQREEEALHGMAEQLSYQASHDVLTNLVNRREFEARMSAAWNSAKTQHRCHALLYLDLDDFKVVNDTCGHRAGDELLKQISATLSSLVRGRDTLARLGGDEFCVLLLDCPLDGAREIAEKLLDAVKSYRFYWEGAVFEVGVSIGVAPIDAHSGDTHDLFQAADSACYIAKSLGKNRIHICGNEDVAASKSA
jgi:diguanylate cyclase (GGDEF)-like protein